jgi:hypothetical protein
MRVCVLMVSSVSFMMVLGGGDFAVSKSASRMPGRACGLLEHGMATSPKPTPESGTHSQINGEHVPRMPHERDESSDSGRTAPRDIMKQAQEDAESDKVDTSRAEATDQAYGDNLRGSKGDAAKP